MNRGESFRRVIANYLFEILKFQFLKSFRQIFPIIKPRHDLQYWVFTGVTIL